MDGCAWPYGLARSARLTLGAMVYAHIPSGVPESTHRGCLRVLTRGWLRVLTRGACEYSHGGGLGGFADDSADRLRLHRLAVVGANRKVGPLAWADPTAVPDDVVGRGGPFGRLLIACARTRTHAHARTHAHTHTHTHTGTHTHKHTRKHTHTQTHTHPHTPTRTHTHARCRYEATIRNLNRTVDASEAERSHLLQRIAGAKAAAPPTTAPQSALIGSPRVRAPIFGTDCSRLFRFSVPIALAYSDFRYRLLSLIPIFSVPLSGG
jgi:hypothetical protein